MALDEENCKIAQVFNQQYYEKWEEYVVQARDPPSIESPKTEILALLCTLGYNFHSSGRDYESLFFDLFCNALREDPTYRRKPPPQKMRPRLFKDPPSHQVRIKFCFVWPIAFKVEGSDISATFHVGIPSLYLYTVAAEGQLESQSGSLCTMLYLVMTDVAASFRSVVTHSDEGNAVSQVECPCLLDYFKRSTRNNQNNLSALIGEYLAFLNVCFELRYHESWIFASEEIGDDFSVSRGEEIRKFSVKTHNEGTNLRFFEEGTLDPSTNAPVNPNHALSDAAVLILNCSCSDCKLNPTVLLAPGANYLETCKRSQAREFIERLYGRADTGRHYLTSACTYFDLRYAISSFSHRSFRGNKFKWRDEFIDCLRSRVAVNNWCDSSCLLWS